MEEQPSTPPSDTTPPSNPANLPQIKPLLQSKDDTQRFVGLALLKSVLDNTPALRDDTSALQDLWESISPKFLDRLLRTGSKPANADAKNMLDLSVSVLHTFAALLPEEKRQSERFTGRIPLLVASLLHSSNETTTLILQLLQVLVNSAEGAKTFVTMSDITPLTEIASTHATALDVLIFAWHNAAASPSPEGLAACAAQIDPTIQSLASAFTGTDAATFLDFLSRFLQDADPAILPREPKWLSSAVTYIHNLTTSRPNPTARAAYTNAAYALLEAYPLRAPTLLFTDAPSAETPKGYLLVNLLLIDIRSSAPSLLTDLNSPTYPSTSRRLTSALKTITLFIGFLVRSLEDEDLETLVMSPDNLLKLRKGISETISLVIEFLRDRWDAAVAGAMGLHPDARAGEANTSAGTHYTLPWGSMKEEPETDPLVGAAVGCLAIWLQEDDNEMLRKEATGLMDMFLDLYQADFAKTRIVYKEMVLVALNALLTLKNGRTQFLSQNGWPILAKDLQTIISQSSTPIDPDARRGIEIIRVLLSIVEEQAGQTPDYQMDVITTVAAWNPDTTTKPSDTVQEFDSAVLTLSCEILGRAAPGLRKQYVHSTHAIRGVATNLQKIVDEDLTDVVKQLE